MDVILISDEKANYLINNVAHKIPETVEKPSQYFPWLDYCCSVK